MLYIMLCNCIYNRQQLLYSMLHNYLYNMIYNESAKSYTACYITKSLHIYILLYNMLYTFVLCYIPSYHGIKANLLAAFASFSRATHEDTDANFTCHHPHQARESSLIFPRPCALIHCRPQHASPNMPFSIKSHFGQGSVCAHDRIPPLALLALLHVLLACLQDRRQLRNSRSIAVST